MKKITSVMMLAAAAAAALVSCNKEIEKPEVPQESEGIKVTIVTGEPETKTVLESNGKSVSWAGTDKVGFFNHTAGVNVQSSAAVIDGDGKATFTATVPAAGTYYAYYPYQADGSYAPDTDGVTVRIPNTQSPTPTSFDPATDLLVSTSFEATGATDTPASIQFKRLGAFIKVQFSDKTTGNKLAGEYASSVSIQAETKIVGRLKISGKSEGQLIDPDSGYQKVTANYVGDTYEVLNAANAVYFGIKPVTLAKNSKLIVTLTTGKYNISKTLTLKKDAVIGAGKLLPITVTIEDTDLPIFIERVWGKYSTSDSYWNASFGGTASADRNIAMDDDYIYLPETTAAAKLWMIPLDGTTDPSLANVEGVSGGTHALSCVRVVPNTSSKVNGGKDFLMACNLTTNSESTALTVYSWNNGTSNAPVSESVSNGRQLRIGDKFSVYGSLQDGALFFRNWNGTDGWGGKGTILVLRMAWADVPSGGYFNPRITFSYEDGGINAYYPYPGDASNGFIANVSATGKYASFTNSPLNTSPNSSGSFTESSGYYENTAGYNFLEYNGKRYVAYVKNAGDGDGRFYILQGETTDSWKDILESKRKVIYQAAIQQDLAYADGDYHEDLAKGVTKTSANSALDCTARIIGEDLYFAVLKQGVGLSLFKMYMK